MRNLGENQPLDARAFLIESRTGLPELSFLPSVRPLKPPEPARLSVEHHRERAEPRPLLAGRDKSLLHPMREDVSNPAKQGCLVEDRLRGVAPFPEGAAPADERANLLRDVRQEVLHERRDLGG